MCCAAAHLQLGGLLFVFALFVGSKQGASWAMHLQGWCAVLHLTFGLIWVQQVAGTSFRWSCCLQSVW
jgi:hypothetical protein